MTLLTKALSRRSFIRKSSQGGAGLTLAVSLPALSQAADSGPGQTSAGGPGADGEFVPNAFVRVTPDDQVVVISKHIEMGQGTYTGLATLVAEELDADWSRVSVEGAEADAKRYNNLLWGPFQGTGGSTAMANSFMQMREAGARARAMLIAAAALLWEVPAAEIRVSQGVVSHPQSDRAVRFGALAELAALQDVPDNVTLKKPEQFTLIGQSLTRKDSGKTTGTALFTQDVQMPGMLTAMVAHPPRVGSRVSGYDRAAALGIKGVVEVLDIPTGVAVLAEDYWSAKQGRDALAVTWNHDQAFSRSSDEIMSQYKAQLEKAGAVATDQGQADAKLAEASETLEATYEFPYLAHATMEPMNCVVQRRPGGVELWYGAQIQTGDQMAVAKVFGIEPADVKINMLLAGGSFGRRASSAADYVVEAAEIAKRYPRAVPIKLVWSREDDTRGWFFRPMYAHRLTAALGEDGMPVAWRHRIVGQSIVKGTVFAGLIKDGIDGTSVEGASNLPYHIANKRVELHTIDQAVPVLWWRSVGSTHTAFSTETFIDELAAKAGKDPVAYREAMLKDHPRHLGVLRLAAEKAGWSTALPEGRFRGVAVHESFNSYVAQVAEIEKTAEGRFRLTKITCAVDCGVAINPDIITAQMEGGIGYGLSPALLSEITLKDGEVQQSNFHDYQVLRINQMPDIEVHIVKSAEPPTGVGEPGTPVVAPAVANALFAATGNMPRKMPFGDVFV